MQKDRPSRTAEIVCFMRATDQRRPPAERTVDDPYARHFLRPALRLALGGLEATGRAGQRTEAELGAGLTAFVLARHRFMDDALVGALEAGAEQVLVLGAGYDTRAWRFAEALDGVPVLEVDHPSTGKRKARIAEALPPADVRRISVDFQTQDLGERLLEGGFAAGARTFVIWEGVSMYLTRAAVGATLDTLRRLCGPGSELVMDWWFLVDAPDARSSVLRMTPQLLHLLGEPATLALHPEDVGGFTLRHGWRAAEVALPAELERRYLRDSRSVYPAMYVTRLTREA